MKNPPLAHIYTGILAIFESTGRGTRTRDRGRGRAEAEESGFVVERLLDGQETDRQPRLATSGNTHPVGVGLAADRWPLDRRTDHRRNADDVWRRADWTLGGQGQETDRRPQQNTRRDIWFPLFVGTRRVVYIHRRLLDRPVMESANNECGICLGEWTNPVKLPCGHSFCEDCLR